jgi:sugar transferase (PEP-CTERM/EpsH1 system associated)
VAPAVVVHVLRSLETGGQEMMCARLVECLDPRRHRPVVVSLQGEGHLGGELRERGIEVRCLNAPEGFRAGLVWRLADLLWRTGARIVHCHNRKAFLYGALAARLAPWVRVVFTKHGASFWEGGPAARLGRALVRRSHAVVAVSEDIAGPLREEGWTSPGRLRTILNGVDTDRFRPHLPPPALPDALGLRPEHRVIGTVARLSPEKDQATLLRAFAPVAQSIPVARLLIVGDGPERGALEALAAELELREHVIFAGERPDVARLLGAMDVFALPSLSEGTSLTLLEAMASGLPVVATAVGGTPEVVADGQTGFLVPPRDPAALAEALKQTLADQDAARRMGSAGRQTVLERYSLAAMVDAYTGLYEELVGGGR